MRSICVGKQLKTVFNFNLSSHEGQQHRRKLNQTFLLRLMCAWPPWYGLWLAKPGHSWHEDLAKKEETRTKSRTVGDQLSRATCIASDLAALTYRRNQWFFPPGFEVHYKVHNRMWIKIVFAKRSCMQKQAASAVGLMDSKTYTRKPLQWMSFATSEIQLGLIASTSLPITPRVDGFQTRLLVSQMNSLGTQPGSNHSQLINQNFWLLEYRQKTWTHALATISRKCL